MVLTPGEEEANESLLVQYICPTMEVGARTEHTQKICDAIVEFMLKQDERLEIHYVSVTALQRPGFAMVEGVKTLYPPPPPVEVEGDMLIGDDGPFEQKPSRQQRRAMIRKQKKNRGNN